MQHLVFSCLKILPLLQITASLRSAQKDSSTILELAPILLPQTKPFLFKRLNFSKKIKILTISDTEVHSNKACAKKTVRSRVGFKRFTLFSVLFMASILGAAIVVQPVIIGDFFKPHASNVNDSSQKEFGTLSDVVGADLSLPESRECLGGDSPKLTSKTTLKNPPSNEKPEEVYKEQEDFHSATSSGYERLDTDDVFQQIIAPDPNVSS